MLTFAESTWVAGKLAPAVRHTAVAESAGSIVVWAAPITAAVLVEAVLVVAPSVDLDISTAAVAVMVFTMSTGVRQAEDVPASFVDLGTVEQSDWSCTTIQE
jgi:hypothetical protein